MIKRSRCRPSQLNNLRREVENFPRLLGDRLLDLIRGFADGLAQVAAVPDVGCQRWRAAQPQVMAEGGCRKEAPEVAGEDEEDELVGGKLVLAGAEEEKTVKWW